MWKAVFENVRIEGGTKQVSCVARGVRVGGLEEIKLLVASQGDAFENDQGASDQRKILRNSEREVKKYLIEISGYGGELGAFYGRHGSKVV